MPEAAAPAAPKPLETAGFFEDKGGATPLLGFANMLGMGLPQTKSSKDVLAERNAASERLAHTYEKNSEEGDAGAKKLEEIAAQQEAQRRAAKPTAPGLDPAPSQQPRLFLQPGDSLLGGFQAAMTGIGAMLLQAKGLRGSAVAAVGALKGLTEGWQAGDTERVRREYDEWKVNSDRLLAQHKLARQEYEDLLGSQKQTWDQTLAQLRVKAEVNGNRTLAEAARIGDIDAVLRWYQQTEQLEVEHEKFRAQMAHWHAQAVKDERNFLATEGHRRETEARAREAGARNERRTKLMEETSGNVLKLQGEDLGITQRLDNMGRVRDAVELLAAEGILPEGATFWDKARATVALQSKPGRGDIANALQTIQRLGTPVLVGTEISLGMQGQTMRLKAIGEAEAGNVAGIPAQFWLDFLKKAESNMRERQTMVRSHLSAINRAAPKADDLEIISTAP